ncbi:MAG: ABC transporter permease [Nitrospirae bacterium]|nr:ABC transporter permease [Nitrospirota bacterium]
MFTRAVTYIGKRTLQFTEDAGRGFIMFGRTLSWSVRPPFQLRNIFQQMEAIGVNSLPVVLIMAMFTGMVLAIQTYTGFKRFNAENFMGTVVALSITRELGPVLTGLIVAGRAGAAMAAELGTMRVTEQIDALVTMATNPIKYLVTPRFLAGLVMLPLLTIVADFVGVVGGYLVAVHVLDANPVIYIRMSTKYVELNDIYGGLLKAGVFGIIISTVSCYKGFYTQGGAEGVGKATTGAVVLSMMLILISNYFLAALLFK